MMKTKIVSLLLCLVIALSLFPIVVSAAIPYRAAVAVTENATAAHTMVGVLWDQNNTWMATNGFMNSTANDTRVQTLGGLNKPWMVTDNKTLTAIPVPLSSQTNLYFVTGENEASSMNIITGDGGYVTTVDHADLELGVDGILEYSGYIRDGIILSKGGSENITYYSAGAEYYSSYTSEVDPSGDIVKGTDNITATSQLDNVDCYDYMITPGIANVDVTFEIKANGQAVNVYGYGGIAFGNTVNDISGFAATDIWVASNARNATDIWLTIGRGASVATDYAVVAAATPYYCRLVKSYGNDTAVCYVYSDPARTVLFDTISIAGCGSTTVYGYAFGYVNYNFGLANRQFDGYIKNFSYEYSAGIYLNGAGKVLHSNISPGQHAIGVSANATSNQVELWVDGSLDDSDTLDAGFANTSDNWTFYADPYANCIKITQAGAETLWYQPNTIISGTTLPNRASAINDGVITWGSNPAGITVTLGSMSSPVTTGIGIGSAGTSDLMPEAGGTDWRPGTDISATLQTNPLRPIVTAISDNTTLSERQVWVWFGIIILIFVAALVGSRVRGHHLITGIAVSVTLVLLVVWTVFPPLSLAVIILAILGGLISERSHSL